MRWLLNDGLVDKRYVLLPEAFLIDPQNYRAVILRKLFSYFGITDCIAFARKFQPMVEFMNTRRDSTETIETILHAFVEYRNVTAHESVTETVSIGEIFSFADFLVILCESLAQLLYLRALRRQIDLGRLILVGTVIHRFSQNICGVCSIGGPVAVEDDIVAASSESAFILVLRSIQSGSASLEFIILHPDQEIGFGFDRPLSVGVQLYKFVPVSNRQVNLPQVDSGSDFQI